MFKMKLLVVVDHKQYIASFTGSDHFSQIGFAIAEIARQVFTSE